MPYVYMNTACETTSQSFTAQDQMQTKLILQRTEQGFDITVDPFCEYAATFEMTAATKAALLAWLAE